LQSGVESVKKDEKIKQLSDELNDEAFYYMGGVDEIIAVSVIKYEKYASGGACPGTNKSMNEHSRKKGGKCNVTRD
jgi:hypothetical protein